MILKNGDGPADQRPVERNRQREFVTVSNQIDPDCIAYARIDVAAKNRTQLRDFCDQYHYDQSHVGNGKWGNENGFAKQHGGSVQSNLWQIAQAHL